MICDLPSLVHVAVYVYCRLPISTHCHLHNSASSGFSLQLINKFVSTQI